MGIRVLKDWLQENEVQRAIAYSLSDGRVSEELLDLFRIERAIDSRYSFKANDKMFKSHGIIYVEYRRKTYLYDVNREVKEC